MFLKAESITMQLGGVHDETAQRTATQVLRRLKGVRSAAVDDRGVATVTYRADQITVDRLAHALSEAGFPII